MTTKEFVEALEQHKKHPAWFVFPVVTACTTGFIGCLVGIVYFFF